ncbi:MAG: hypothetical protein EA363_01750, partial [Balneolaceae bacterium]
MAMPLVQAQHQEWINYTTSTWTFTVARDGDHLWTGSRGGITVKNIITGSRIYYNAANSPLSVNRVHVITMGAEGTKWIGTGGGGLIRIQGDEWTIYHEGNSGIPSNTVHAVFEDNDGVVWVGMDDGLARFDGEDWEVYHRLNSP